MKVKVYSTPTCPHCIHLKRFLEEHKIEYEDIDVSRDRKAAQEMVEKSKQLGVPVVDIDGRIIVGFNRDAVKDALKL
jgi:glutaredoxin-like YruB-family protein